MKLKLRFKKRQARQLGLCCDNSRPGHGDQPFRWRLLQMLGKIFLKSAWKHLRTNKIMKNSWLKIQGMMETELWRGWAQHYDCFSLGVICCFHSGVGQPQRPRGTERSKFRAHKELGGSRVLLSPRVEPPKGRTIEVEWIRG